MTRSLDVEDIFAGMAERDLSLAGNGDALKFLDLPIQVKDAGHAEHQAGHRAGQQQASCDVPQPRGTDPPDASRACKRTRISHLHIHHRSLKAAGPTESCSQPGDYYYMTPVGTIWLAKCQATTAATRNL